MKTMPALYCRPMRACAVLCAVVLLASGCSDPPTREHDQAEGALAAARAADAAIYAPDEMNSAIAALQKYDTAVTQRDYRLALSLALEAFNSANEAAKRAGNEKAAARSRAEAMAAELDALLKTAAARLAGTSMPRLSVPTAERVRQNIPIATQALQEARTRLGAADYRGVVSQIEPIVQQFRVDLGGAAPATGRGRG